MSLYFITHSVVFEITVAGFPITIQFEGIRPLTTAPAPIIQLSPIFVPGSITQLAPIKQLFPT